jgi:CBS domain-containing protein
MKSIGTIGALLHHKGASVWSISPQETVFAAIQLLAKRNIGALLVMEGERLVGIFSERDYTRKIALEGRSSRDTQVGEIISASVITVTPEHTIEECMRMMTESRIRHLPVMEDEKVIGVVSIGDLVNWVISAQTAALDQMEAYIAGR